MKYFSKTLIFASFVFLVIGYSVFEFNNEKKAYDSKVENSKIFPGIKSADVKEFKYIIEKNQKSFFVKKNNKVWLLKSPLQDFADQEFIQQLLSQLLEDQVFLVSSGPLSPEKKVEYGLSQPLLTVSFKSHEGRVLDLVVGSLNTADNKVFVHKLNEDQVFVASSFWHNLADKQGYDFRRKNIYKYSGSVQKLSIFRSGAKETHLTYDSAEQQWKNDSDSSVFFTRKSMGQLVSTLESISIFRFLSEIQNKSLLNKYGLIHPLFELELKFESSNQIKNWKLTVSSEDQEKHYAIISGRPHIFQLNKKEVIKIKQHLNELQ